MGWELIFVFTLGMIAGIIATCFCLAWWLDKHLG